MEGKQIDFPIDGRRRGEAKINGYVVLATEDNRLNIFFL